MKSGCIKAENQGPFWVPPRCSPHGNAAAARPTSKGTSPTSETSSESARVLLSSSGIPASGLRWFLLWPGHELGHAKCQGGRKQKPLARQGLPSLFGPVIPMKHSRSSTTVPVPVSFKKARAQPGQGFCLALAEVLQAFPGELETVWGPSS